jgi:hypothetical protein
MPETNQSLPQISRDVAQRLAWLLHVQGTLRDSSAMPAITIATTAFVNATNVKVLKGYHIIMKEASHLQCALISRNFRIPVNCVDLHTTYPPTI